MNNENINELEKWWEAESEVSSFDFSLGDLNSLIQRAFEIEIKLKDNWGI